MELDRLVLDRCLLHLLLIVLVGMVSLLTQDQLFPTFLKQNITKYKNY
jgi:hypothetical protein